MNNFMLIRDEEIKSHVHEALNHLLKNDSYLLLNDLSERSISNKIAHYLTPLFPDYDVDCEYNGDIDRRNNRKAISILKSDLEEAKLLTDYETDHLEDEITSRSVFPDIIIHKRGFNKYNLGIIEVKKSTSRIDFAYDRMKLESYTSNKYGNNLQYQLGIFIEVVTRRQSPDFNLLYYKDGNEIQLG